MIAKEQQFENCRDRLALAMETSILPDIFPWYDIVMRTRLLASVFALAALVACTKTSDIPVNDFSSLIRNLQDAGYDVVSDPSPSDALFPFPESRVLLEDTPMQVYTFGTPAEADHGVKLIAADGTKVDQVTLTVENPVFYRKESLIVVYTQEDAGVNAYLTTILGDPVYPKPVAAPAPSSAQTASGTTY